nr:PREDICTED: sulfotransferase family cytosolic 2B member 1 [Anolis carolinensis]|eukprot:XP_016852911.1 PREDICTED: sulfotransferase family cytosolic 2B member 1 [Anolis carolinensis]
MARLAVTETFFGIQFPGHLHTQDSLQAATNFPFRPSDVLLVTYPKSGTTWMQEILTFIHSEGDPEPAKTTPNWARLPWLEHLYNGTLAETPEPRLLTTHLPYPALAEALAKAKPKVIYLARNPKDVAVSYYHFCQMANFFPDPGSFEEFVQKFLDGTVHYGSWFEHVKGWLSCQEESNISYFTYEELHQDLEGCVERLCAFLGISVKPELAEAVRTHCSFASMRENAMVNTTLVPKEILDPSKGQFMRKGIAGDWKNHFSAPLSDRFNTKFQEELGSQGQRFRWAMD